MDDYFFNEIKSHPCETVKAKSKIFFGRDALVASVAPRSRQARPSRSEPPGRDKRDPPEASPPVATSATLPKRGPAYAARSAI